MVLARAGRSNGAAASMPAWKSSQPSGTVGPIDTRYFSEGESATERSTCPMTALFAYGDNHLYIGGVAAVYDVFFGEQVGGRYAHGAYLVQGDDGEPEFIAAFEYEHHHVAALDAQRLEKRGRLVALSLDVGKGEIDVAVFFVGPAEGLFVRGYASPFVDDVVSEVEIFGYVYMEVFDEIFLRGEVCLFQKFL